jgi:hypothetical protein
MAAEAIRIMVLAVFNHDEIYDEFYKINMEYLDALKTARPHVYENIRFYYVVADPGYDNSACGAQVDESARMITVNGTESWCPGILDKTIKVLRHVNDLRERNDNTGFKYDYVLRTNASTFINFELLYNEMLELHAWNSVPYRNYKYVAMGHISVLQCGNDRYGLTEQAMQLYMGEKFFQGVCIIMNAALVSELVRHAQTRINLNVVDDVEIGRFIWSLPSTPDELYTKDISDRMLSYYQYNPSNPYIFCNNRYKANRYSDLDCFRSVAEMHTNKLINNLNTL